MNRPLEVNRQTIRSLGPPRPEGAAHKGVRGRVLVVGGTAETPGAALLAGIAALRAGAGVLCIATAASVATAVAVAAPEARVVGLEQGPSGDIAPAAAGQLADLAADADAVLVGPGLSDVDALRAILPAVLAAAPAGVILDARALSAVTPEMLRKQRERVLLTPNTKEAAELLDVPVADVEADAETSLRRIVDGYGCAVTVRGGETFTTAPGGPVYVDRCGTAGLGTSGSGDVLSGFAAGLLARGATPLGAAVCAVHVHALAGQRLSGAIGHLGFLARELLDALTPVVTALERKR